jgi:hypothetical protein
MWSTHGFIVVELERPPDISLSTEEPRAQSS